MTTSFLPLHTTQAENKYVCTLYFATSGKAKALTATFSDFTLLTYSETLRSSLDLLPREHQYQTKTLII